jgi:threonine synthase
VTARLWRGVIEEYRDRLPVDDATPVVTLCEGGTPLVRSEPLSQATGCEVWLKYEGANPTASFKDRGMTLAISKALEEGSKAVVCASTGNTSASAAAYAAKAGLTCAVLVPKGKVALGKMAGTLVHGARVLEVQGNFDESFELAQDLAAHYPVTLVNSVNPYRLQGQKTLAFEVVDALGRAPDLHFVPVGNAGNISSHWMGYSEYLADGIIHEPPRLFGFQAAGAAPIVAGAPVKDPQTIATAIRIGNPASWDKARGHRPRDPLRVPEDRPRGTVRGARLSGQRRGALADLRARRPAQGRDRGLRPHRTRPEGSRVGDHRGRPSAVGAGGRARRRDGARSLIAEGRGAGATKTT